MTQRIKDVLNETGLNWTVRKEETQTSSGIIIPDQIAIVREDNDTILGTHGKNYYPYQNHQLAELLDRVSSKIGLPIHKGGLFGDGEKVFIQLKSQNMNLGNDRIEGFITGINSFDGSTSLAFGPSNITISCMNAFFASFRHIQTKIRHTTNMEIRIEDVVRRLEMAMEEEKKIFTEIRKLSEFPATEKTIEWATRVLFDIKKEMDLKSEDLSSVTKNRLSRFEIDMNGQIKDKGKTMWGLFSGVTAYTTHSMTKHDNTENKMFGTYGNRERVIFNELANAVS